MHDTMEVPALAPRVARALTEAGLEAASGGTRITKQVSFPGIVFRFGFDNNGDLFGSAAADKGGVHHLL